METRLQRFMYDDRLSPMARIYLSEISKYYGTNVSCFDNDYYFASIFKVSTRQVARWKKEVLDLGYVAIKTDEMNNRIIQYIPDIEKHIVEDSNMKVEFITFDYKIIHNSFEAQVYFNNYLDHVRFSEDTPLTENLKGDLRTFCHVFANSLFNESFYNIRLGGMVITLEFMQYVMGHFKMQTIFRPAIRTIQRFAKIENLNLYIMTAIVNIYKDEYELFKESKNYNDWREQLKKPMDVEKMEKSMIKDLQRELYGEEL